MEKEIYIEKLTLDAAKRDVENKIYEYLNENCRPYSAPIPHILTDQPIKCEIVGIMGKLICDAFQKMRDTNGQSNWECDAKCNVGTKVSEKRVMTLNKLRKVLMECQGHDLIEYAKERDDEIIVKINVTWLFEDIYQTDEKVSV
jgi:hypothetical protein